MAHDAIVIGSGIVGLAMARALALKGRKVLVLERNARPVGASIRNFGMVWPIGQPEGPLHERALVSTSVWKEICVDTGMWHDASGSLHLAFNALEMQVLASFHASVPKERGYRLLDAAEVLSKSPAAVGNGLIGGLYSPEEMIVDPVLALQNLPNYLTERLGVEFGFGVSVDRVESGRAYSGGRCHEAEEVFICTGPDFEILFPDLYPGMPLTRCKLQMMRMGAQPDGWRLGPSLCGGLSLVHYRGFEAAGDSLVDLKRHYEEHMREYIDNGIHVMVSQNAVGELIVGDSHEYGLTHDPFIRGHIDGLILDYLRTFARFPREEVTHHWYGLYTKMLDGSTELVLEVSPGVTVVNGLGGAGMTMSFGLAHEIVSGCYKRE